MAAPNFAPGESHLHSVSLILGRIINDAFGKNMTEVSWKKHSAELLAWYESLPDAVRPFSSTYGTVEVLPQIWFLQDYHGMFYCILYSQISLI